MFLCKDFLLGNVLLKQTFSNWCPPDVLGLSRNVENYSPRSMEGLSWRNLYFSITFLIMYVPSTPLNQEPVLFSNVNTALPDIEN